MKTKSLEERLKEFAGYCFKLSMQLKLYNPDGSDTCNICGTSPNKLFKEVEKLIKSELDNRDKEWIEAVGEESYCISCEILGEENFNGWCSECKQIKLRNQLRLEIKNKMEIQK
jgi:hypothetical protein